jgi:hypothetical protein
MRFGAHIASPLAQLPDKRIIPRLPENQRFRVQYLEQWINPAILLLEDFEEDVR